MVLLVYMTDFAAVTDKHGVTLHAFADDTQTYLHCHPDVSCSVVRLERYIVDVDHWMSANRLKQD